MGLTTRVHLWQTLKEWRVALRSSAARSRLFQRLYSYVELLLGWTALKRKRYFMAADHFCKASRRVAVDTVARRRARVQLRKFFQPEGVPGTLEDFLRTPLARALHRRFSPQPFPLNVTFRSNLLPVKAYDPRTGEKGVLILTLNYLYLAFHAMYQTPKLRESYWMVLEPSYHHIEETGYVLFHDWRVVLQAGNPVLRSDLRWLGSSFETVPLTSSDWTDSDFFRPLADQTKIYDLIYVANWSRNKQHELLFRTLKKIQRPLRVALVGFRWERTREEIEMLMKKVGVADRCEIFERVSASEVNRLLNRSRANLLLSRFEGGNKALYEAMFADLPSIVYRYCQGLDSTCINEHTGVLVEDAELADAILEVVDRSDRFSPRRWALTHTGYLKSTQLLNEKLRELSLNRGEPWTTDIAPKVNRSDPAYKTLEDAKRLEPALNHLSQFLRAKLP